MYPDAKEEFPTNAPPPHGWAIELSCFMNNNNAGDQKTRRSQTGIILYCNSAVLLLYGTVRDKILWKVVYLVQNQWPCGLHQNESSHCNIN